MSRSHARHAVANSSPEARQLRRTCGGITANGVRPTTRLEKAENIDTQRGTTSQAGSRDRTDFRHAGTYVTDAAAFRPVAAAFAADDVVPAPCTPDSVSDAERHDSPTRRPAITSANVTTQRFPLTTRPGVCVAEPRRDAATRRSRRVNAKWRGESLRAIHPQSGSLAACRQTFRRASTASTPDGHRAFAA